MAIGIPPSLSRCRGEKTGQRNCQRSGHRQAFTLFEIAISMAIMALGVVTIMALIPVGLKAQQKARFAAYSSAKALDMLEMFNCQVPANHPKNRHDTVMSMEVDSPWDTTTSSRVMTQDLEVRLATIRGGLVPLPSVIAKRLDSDGDEIADLLAAGGRLYYPNPMASSDAGFGSINYAWSGYDQNEEHGATLGRTMFGISESRRILVGIVGPAQKNKIPVNPFKSWPYYHGYPSPPVPCEWISPKGGTFPTNSPDPDAWTLYREGYKSYHIDDFVPSSGIPGVRPDLPRCERYVRLAFWYARKQLLPPEFLDGNAQDIHVEAHYANADHVRTLRYLAHATTCLTRWYTAAQLTSTVILARQDITADDGTVVISASDPYNLESSISLDRIRNWHQRCLDLVMKHAASFPYNWGALRPINRAIMMDVPLLEWDLFPDTLNPLLSGVIKTSWSGPPTVQAQQYRMLAPMAINSTGQAMVSDQLSTSDQGFRDHQGGGDEGLAWQQGNMTATPNNVFGNIDHFTLTRKFSPDERCRELVFWMVDWQAYEDSETAPSAPMDASKFPIRLQQGDTIANRMKGFSFNTIVYASYFNPERNLLHIKDLSLQPNGLDTSTLTISPTGGAGTAASAWADNYNFDYVNDKASTPAGFPLFSGLYGADRNQNGVLDRGPLVQSVRMRATTIARFVVYDPRLPLTLR